MGKFTDLEIGHNTITSMTKRPLAAFVDSLVGDEFFWATGGPMTPHSVYRVPFEKKNVRKPIYSRRSNPANGLFIFHPWILVGYVKGVIPHEHHKDYLYCEEDAKDLAKLLEQDQRLWMVDKQQEILHALYPPDVKKFVEAVVDMRFRNDRDREAFDTAATHDYECRCAVCAHWWLKMADKMPLEPQKWWREIT